MKTIVIANQKGGVAKTTTARALAEGLAKAGKRVLAIDLDAQANLTENCGLAQDDDLYEALKGTKLPKNEALLRCIYEREPYDVVPSTIMLASLEQELSGMLGRELKLKEAIEDSNLAEDYDFIVIDTPPALSVMTINALVSADLVIIPSMADINASKGIAQLGITIENIKKYYNPNLAIAGILLTRYDARLNISKASIEDLTDLAESIGTKVYETKIRASVVVPESSYLSKEVGLYAPSSTVAEDYAKFTDEFLKGIA